MRTIIEYMLYGLVVLPASTVLIHVLDVATLPALGVVFMVSFTTTCINTLTEAMRDAGF